MESKRSGSRTYRIMVQYSDGKPMVTSEVEHGKPYRKVIQYLDQQERLLRAAGLEVTRLRSEVEAMTEVTHIRIWFEQER